MLSIPVFITTYDAGFIALAEKLNCSLISGDAKQVAAAVALGITLKPITDFASNP